MKKLLLFLPAILFIMVSCRKKFPTPAWDIDALFPIASTTLKITDLVKDSILKVNSDSSLSVVFSGEVYKIDFDSLFKIPDTAITQSFTFFFPTLWLPPGATLINSAENTKYNLQQVELVEAIIRSGTVEVELKNSFKGKTIVNYQLPLALKNGNPFVVTDTLPAAAPGNPYTIIRTYDISGYNFDLRGLNGNNFNTVVSVFNATTLDSVLASSGDDIKITNRFKNVIPEYARGYFGKTKVSAQPSNQAVNNLYNITESNIDIKDIFITMNIQNRIGVDIQFSLDRITALNSVSEKNVSLESSFINSFININRAQINPALSYPPVVSSEYIMKMNSVNSNADALIEINPDSISAAATFILNSLGNISNSNDFVYYGNGIDVSLDVEMPLCFIANNLVFSDTVEVNFKPEEGSAEDEESKKIKGGNLILNAYNEYPFSAIPQLFLMNENYAITDSMVAEGQIIEAADLDGNLKSAGKKFSRVYMPLNEQKIEELKAAKYIMIRTSFTTAGQPDYIKIYSNYSIDIKLVADINYAVDPN